MSHVFGRSAIATPPVATRGKGVYLYDQSGKAYLDASGGAAVSCLGHGDTRLTEAVKQQLDQLAYAHTSFFTSEPAERLAEQLARYAPDGIERVYFVSGGSEAVEASLKLARQYFVEKGEAQRDYIIARRQSYHGNTLGALSAGGNAWRRAQFQPLLSESMNHIDPCYFWRWGEPGESARDYGRRMADQLEERILELGAERVAAFIAEPVVGATLGAVAAEDGYFTRIREICDQYGVLLIFDEVMCGMGRTGYLFASEAEHVVPDIVCIAKGLGAGIQPLGAMLCSDDIYHAIQNGSGFFQHGHTYLAHPAACAAGVAVLELLTEKREGQTLVDRVRHQGPSMLERLTSVLGTHPNMGDIRGRGYFIGLEVVADKQSKAPMDPDLRTHAALKRAAFENGLLMYPMGGTVDGKSGDHILLAPPFTLSDDEEQEMTTKLVSVVASVLG